MRIPRPRFRWLLLGFILFALAASRVSAAEPSIGATLGTADDKAVVISTATVPITVSLSVDGGWGLDRDTLRLAPGERQTVHVTKQGEGPGLVVAYVTAVNVAPGMDKSSFVLTGNLKQTPPAFSLMTLWWLALVVIGLLVGLALWLARRSMNQPRPPAYRPT